MKEEMLGLLGVAELTTVGEPFELVIDHQESFQSRIEKIGPIRFGPQLQARFWPTVTQGVVVYEAQHFGAGRRITPTLAAKSLFLIDGKRPWIPARATHLFEDAALMVECGARSTSVAALWARLQRQADEYLLTVQMGDGEPSFVIQQTSLELLASTLCLGVREVRRYRS